MTKSNYPDWVMKYKSKGVYVNKKGDTYYLYKAHSVRIKGTHKVKRICDGYIGRVTEKDGFIPVKDKVLGQVDVFEYGLFFFLSQLSTDIYSSFKRSHKKHADTILSLGILLFLDIDIAYYDYTGLFTLFPKTNVSLFYDKEIVLQSQRVKSMLSHFIESRITPADWKLLKHTLPMVHIARINGNLYLSSIDQNLAVLLDKYDMEVTINAKSI